MFTRPAFTVGWWVGAIVLAIVVILAVLGNVGITECLLISSVCAVALK